MADIEINLDDDKEDKTVKKPEEKADDVIVETDKEPAKPELKVEDAVAELKKRLQEEENARKDAEKRAREAERTATVAKAEVEDANLHLVTGAVETLKRDLSILKSNYKAALAAGNYEEAAEAQEKMNMTSNKLSRLEEGKIQLEKKPKTEVPPAKSDADAVETFAARLSPKSAEWIRKHPECVTDFSKNQVMIGAHTMAMGKRIPVDTPEYFEFIENALGYSSTPKSEPSGDSEGLQQSSGGRQAASGAAPAAAPVSRTASSNGSTRPNVVRLSEAEREIADSMGMTYQEYARNKQALQKAGKIN